MAENTLHLSVVDQNAARAYIQTLLTFPFPDTTQAENAVQALLHGLRVTVTRFPFLAGTLGLADPKTGKLSLIYPTEISEAHMTSLFAFDMLTAPEFLYTYEQLKEQGMPLSALTGRCFCPYVLRGKPGIPDFAEGIVEFNGNRVPVSAVQAFFIPGGLILSIYVHHSALDCHGIDQFWKHFADSVSPEKSGQFSFQDAHPDHSAMRARVDAGIPAFARQPIADAFMNRPYCYDPTLHGATLCSARLFVIPAQCIRAYRDELRKSVRTERPLTVCNVLSALFWIHITRARSRRLLQYGYDTTNIGIAVDSRRRSEPRLGSDYMGNMAFFAKASMPIANLVVENCVTDQTIIPVIQCINGTISGIGNAWVQRHLGFFQSKVPIQDTEPALGFKFGPDIYITSWMNFGAEHEWNIPGTTSTMPEFIRRTHSGSNSDGGIMIFPHRRSIVDGKEAPYEVMVRLATEDMERVMDEEGGLAKRWADRVID